MDIVKYIAFLYHTPGLSTAHFFSLYLCDSTQLLEKKTSPNVKEKTAMPVIVRGIRDTSALKQHQLTKTVKCEVNSNEWTSDPRMASQAHTTRRKQHTFFKTNVQVEIMPQTKSHKKKREKREIVT